MLKLIEANKKYIDQYKKAYNLLKYSGHIGYDINPLCWKKGYGTELLKLGLEKAKELIKYDKVLITCDDDNIGSYKIIEKMVEF